MGSCVSQPPKNKDSRIRPNDPAYIDGKRIFYDKTADMIIRAYIHFGGKYKKLYDIYIPRDIVWLISTYQLRSMIIESSTICQLQSGIKYYLDELTLKKWSVLTVNGYDHNKRDGGILFLKVGILTLEGGSSINMNGKGYQSNKLYQISGNNKLLFKSHELKLGEGYKSKVLTAEPHGGNGGGCIYIECDTLNMSNANILSCGN